MPHKAYLNYMNILHTSDWHLGRVLYGKKRYAEFSAFLDWLYGQIQEKEVDVLLVAGDVFDTTTPSNRAQELYYRFLTKVATSTSCHHLVIIAGNHDSPSFLNAPKQILRTLNVHVIGAASESPADEIHTLQYDDAVQAIVCAVPYLRDKDLRTAEPGETIEQKNANLLEGMRQHYAAVCEIASQRQQQCTATQGTTPPIIGMGHLFTKGGKTTEKDGVRELYVGSLLHAERDIFPACISYLALGHLHVPQLVDNSPNMRYCGSPLPMGFGEANQAKQVVLVQYQQGCISAIQEVSVPCFQQLVRVAGDRDEILAQVDTLKTQESHAWLEVEYTGDDATLDLKALLTAATDGSRLEVIKVINRQVISRVLASNQIGESLEEVSPDDVFTRFLDDHQIEEAARGELCDAYRDILTALYETDHKAE